ncbi:Sds3-like-domain-containing protein [Annulohypoxylon nitens]|nr:Sds3-like-domain-containing protein [Annulohypoxylon nitens]
MATTESTQPSALATTNKTTRLSPPPSKRDKKRQNLNDRLAVLQDKFSRDKDKHYRDELHKIQIDVNLVGRVDPYADRPLDVIDREYRDIQQSANAQSNATTSSNGSPKRSLLEMAGPTFGEWVHQVEDLVEHRDYDMTCQKAEYERKTIEYESVRAYKLEVAKREYATLSNTLRDRLINAITAKKYRLGKEKEALDISDSSALLLHPNQYSYTNPASPGGTHGKRNTRLRREMEEMPGFAEGKKRKRNGADDEGSPAPKRGALDSTNTTPFWLNERGLRSGASHKEPAPTYSLKQLFTDKEQGMAYNNAALAAYKNLMVRRDANGNPITPDDNDTGNGDANGDEDTGAVTMERQPSHTTRSTRGGHIQPNFHDDQLTGIEALANFEIPGNLDKMGSLEPKLPPLNHATYSKAYRRDESNTPLGLGDIDRERDLAAVKLLKAYQTKHGVGSNLDATNGGRRLLELMTTPVQKATYATFLQGKRASTEALQESLGIQDSDLRDNKQGAKPDGTEGHAGAKDSIPMSRQSSLGGAAMSRSGSARGKRKA